MTNLQTALQRVLRQVREETKHLRLCASLEWTFEHAREYGAPCTCDWQERVEAEQARRVGKILSAACVAAVNCTPLLDVDKLTDGEVLGLTFRSPGDEGTRHYLIRRLRGALASLATRQDQALHEISRPVWDESCGVTRAQAEAFGRGEGLPVKKRPLASGLTGRADLEAELWPYLMHKAWCALNPCNCGLKELLPRLAGPAQEGPHA